MADPNLEIRPDFASEPYEGIRHVMADTTGETHQQVAQRLAEAWDVEHNTRIDAWNHQQEEERQVEEREQQEERNRQEDQRCLDEADAEKERKEAEKKKPKINDFDADLPPPSVIVPRPSQYAIQKLTSFEFVEMWYFSPEGCAEATRHHRSQADDAFGLAASNDRIPPGEEHPSSPHETAVVARQTRKRPG
ncbi:hypothetical protein JVT61DRAFT_1605 [Boletus reticuloceps]|uniref:Uncharacterized protein n=1 Tax=Boletus reticuloceps TaxID=495285 RepID=A0A8I2YSN4_9AGAM|nr:hypothetical protein JVT61DRAFT_1605 [Boletus reticuloceps]